MPKLNNILIVDDEHDMLAIAKISLQNLGGMTVSTAGGVSDALTIVNDESDLDMILLDIVMPEVDGLRAMQMFRHAGFEGPIVVMSARVRGEEVDTYRALGASGIIAKPFDVTTLSNQLEQVWNDFGGVQ